MDERSVELAKEGLAIFSQHVAPAYERNREELLASLAIEGASLESLKQHDLREQATLKLLTGFVSELPDTSSDAKDGYFAGKRWIEHVGFALTDPAQTRAMQATAVWLPDHPYLGLKFAFENFLSDESLTFSPYYVIGANGSTGECLLARPGTSIYGNSGIFVLDPANNEKNVIKQLPARKFTPLTPDDLNNAFMKDKHKLRLTAETRNSLFFKRPGKQTAKLDRFSDDMIARFNVFDHLNEVATVFGKEEELNAWLDAYDQALTLIKDPTAISILDQPRTERDKHFGTPGYL